MTALESCMVNHHHPRVKMRSPLLKSSLEVCLPSCCRNLLPVEFRWGLTLWWPRQKPCPVQRGGRLSGGEPSRGSEGGHGIIHPQPTTRCPVSPWGFGGTREWVSLGHVWQEPLQPALSGPWHPVGMGAGQFTLQKPMGWSPHEVVPRSCSVPRTLEAKHPLAGPLQPPGSRPPPHPESRSCSRDSDQQMLKGNCDREMLSWGKPACWASSLPFFKPY